MESNTPEINPLQDDVENAIESLRSILNNNYLFNRRKINVVA